MPRRLALVLGACAVLVAGCGFGFEVIIPAGSTIETLAFEFGDSDGRRLRVVPSSIGVYACDQIHARPNGNFYPPPSEAVWSARMTTLDGGTPMERLAYGKDEHGLRTAHGPAPLKAYGCYVVHIDGRAVDAKGSGGTAGFTVASDRTVVQMTPSEYDKIFSK